MTAHVKLVYIYKLNGMFEFRDVNGDVSTPLDADNAETRSTLAKHGHVAIGVFLFSICC